ncbi:MAG: TraB/GumN family protein [Oscillospiraceae bacterium]|nr:TraB/GumN family protein [Oscillospiraceae bacterium]
MRKYRKLLSLLLCAAMLLSLLGCGKEAEPTQPPVTEPPATEAPTEPAAAAAYDAAAAALTGRTSLQLSITTKESIKVSGETFQTSGKQTVNISSDTVSAENSMTIGEYILNYTEYHDGTVAYGELSDYIWKSELDQESYLSRYTPAAALTSQLYGSVTAAEEGGNTVYTFEEPTAAEGWAMPEEGTLLSASGTATVSAEGQLTRCDYSISYTLGAAQVDRSVTVIVSDAAGQAVPMDTAGAVTLEAFDAPILLDTAYLNLIQANAVTSTITQSTSSFAAEYVLVQQDQYDTYGTGTTYRANIQQAIAAQDFSGNSDSYTQTENYQDGTYSVSQNGGAPSTEALSYAAVQSYCQESISGAIWSPEWITSASIADLGSVYLLKMTGSDELGELYCLDACNLIFGDENALNDAAESYSTATVESYLALDKYTGLPTAAGYSYAGSHTIDGQEYLLTDAWSQSIILGSATAYETITGEALPESVHETEATPLFYHVTGADGQEMWLLGTIHVGDARNASLPQEIYDALDSSAALAVEFDTDAFTADMTTDADLTARIAAAYCYTDGSTTADHLDAELYQNAVDLLTASGSYNASMLVMKPSVYTQAIQDFYIRQGTSLVAEKGVDSRLLRYARDNSIEIRDIESGIFQLELLMGFSDELQEYLLKDTLNYTSLEYGAETTDLYEKWCAGDEAVLREALTEDLSELTAEELPLYEEYNKAMNTDRNEGMLEAATEYLESGETVFYAVGLAHLLDSTNGLVDALRAAGYTVELVSYN